MFLCKECKQDVQAAGCRRTGEVLPVSSDLEERTKDPETQRPAWSRSRAAVLGRTGRCLRGKTTGKSQINPRVIPPLSVHRLRHPAGSPQPFTR